VASEIHNGLVRFGTFEPTSSYSGVGEKRKLTDEEIAKVRRYVLDRERARHPSLTFPLMLSRS
jgi:hypothetical protein